MSVTSVFQLLDLICYYMVFYVLSHLFFAVQVCEVVKYTYHLHSLAVVFSLELVAEASTNHRY
jgi:hypothetical protein